MIILVCALLAFASVPLSGGRLGRLVHLPLVHPWAPVLALVLQTVAVDGPLSTLHPLPWILHAASYVLAVWALWANRHLPNLWIVAVGGMSNVAAIVANGGVMPATPTAVAAAGIPVSAEFANSAASTGSPLWWLGDVFAIPASWPLSNVFSVGDVVLVVGLTVMLHRLARTPQHDPSSPSDTVEDVVAAATV